MIFLNLPKRLVMLVLCFLSMVANAQKFILPNAYAHNDYRHKRPLLDALHNGFTYIEADIYLRRERLIVAHILPRLKKKKTLEEIYLKPLLAYVEEKNKSKADGIKDKGPLTLMIDIKSNANKTYKVLALLLEKYKSIISGYEGGCLTIRNITVVITGNKPYELVNCNSNRLVFMDEDLKQAGIDSTSNVYPIASCKYSDLVKWKGKGNIPDSEAQQLEHYVAQAHKNGRKVRLWASPENKIVWAELLRCNVDLINTDRLKTLRSFLVSDMLLTAKK